MIPGFSTRRGWERGWKSYMANSKDWRSKNVNAIKLNCNVVKKVATPPPPPPPTLPPFLHQSPLLKVYLSFLTKNAIPPKWLNFCKVGGGGGGGGGGRSNYVGFLPKFGMSVAMDVHNLYILIKLKIAFFIPG